MDNITWLEALLLEEIGQSKAEIYTDREPVSVFINNRVGDLDLVPVINKFVNLKLVEVIDRGPFKEFTVNEHGTWALKKYFLPKSPSKS